MGFTAKCFCVLSSTITTITRERGHEKNAFYCRHVVHCALSCLGIELCLLESFFKCENHVCFLLQQDNSGHHGLRF